MNWSLKLLSGHVAGAEYPLTVGDTVFVVGAQRQLWDGSAIGYASADNVLFVPDAGPSSVFVVRVTETEDAVVVQIGVPTGEEQGLEFTVVPLQSPHQVGGLWLAVGHQGQPWADAVREFVVPKSTPVIAAQPKRRRWQGHVGAALAVAVLAMGALWWWGPWQRDPSVVGVAALQEALQNGPEHFEILAGRDHHLYVFARKSEDLLWAKRAVQSLPQQEQTVFVTTDAESERIGRLLDSVGRGAALINLNHPRQPQVRLINSVAGNAAAPSRTQQLLMTAMPYAEQVAVAVVDGQALARQAQAELGALGISAKVSNVGGNVSVMNDVVLNDADLAAMLNYRKRFTEQWGERVVAIRIELWDDLTKGQSYEYGPQQLLTTGQGHWTFLHPVSN